MSDFLLLARRGDWPMERLSHGRLSFTCEVPGFPQGQTREVVANGAYVALFNAHAGATLTEARLALGDVGLLPVAEANLGRDAIEFRSDHVGSRPVWFYHDETSFVASSSQFCITSLFDDLDLSHDAVGWLLASGYVGHVADDRRVQRLPGASSLTLNRHDWSVSLVERRVAPPRRDSVDSREIAALIDRVIGKIRIPSSPVLVPISGGAGSRVLLAK